MLGNPPWERIKLQEEEFFASRSPLVAMAKNKAERGQRIEWLRDGVLLHNLDPDLEAAEGLTPPNRAEMDLVRRASSPPAGVPRPRACCAFKRALSADWVGDVNTYALFAETFLQSTAPKGRAGFIVPTGIATDDSTKAYFERLAIGGHLRRCFAWRTRSLSSQSVHHASASALLTLAGCATEASHARLFRPPGLARYTTPIAASS
jgi:hypothetical protein